MQLVRGPSWIPVRIALWAQLLCVLAGALALSFWCIVIGAAYLVDPEVGANKIVAMSLIGLIFPFGILASILAMPIALLTRRLAIPARLILEALPWLVISHWLMSRLPIVYHRTPADILPGRFNWLWLSIAALAAFMGPITAEQWVVARRWVKSNNTRTRAKIAAIEAEAANVRAKAFEDGRKDEAKAAEEIARWKADTRSEPAFAESQVAFWETHQRIARLRALVPFGPERDRMVQISRAFTQLLKSHPGTSFESCRSRTDAIRGFLAQTDWQGFSVDLSNDRTDALPGDVSRATRR
jgi:hypothetical protein